LRYSFVLVFFVSSLSAITWTIDPSAFANNMTMTTHVAVDGTNETNGTLAAFAGAEIRGLQSSSSVLPSGHYTGQNIYSITLYGDSNGVALTFKIIR